MRSRRHAEVGGRRDEVILCEAFWSAQIKLMTRSMLLTEDDLVAAATDLGVNDDFALGDNDAVRHARARVEARAKAS